MRYGYSLTGALDCFEDNLRLFGDVHAQPEKYNLYNGLANLAHSVTQTEEEIRRLLLAVGEVQRLLRERS
jgi:hypothetical protein